MRLNLPTLIALVLSLNRRGRSPSSCLCNCRKSHRKWTTVLQTDCDSINTLVAGLQPKICREFSIMHAYWLNSHPIRTLLMFHCLLANFSKKSGTSEAYCCCCNLFIYLYCVFKMKKIFVKYERAGLKRNVTTLRLPSFISYIYLLIQVFHSFIFKFFPLFCKFIHPFVHLTWNMHNLFIFFYTQRADTS